MSNPYVNSTGKETSNENFDLNENTHQCKRRKARPAIPYLLRVLQEWDRTSHHGTSSTRISVETDPSPPAFTSSGFGPKDVSFRTLEVFTPGFAGLDPTSHTVSRPDVFNLFFDRSGGLGSAVVPTTTTRSVDSSSGLMGLIWENCRPGLSRRSTRMGLILDPSRINIHGSSRFQPTFAEGIPSVPVRNYPRSGDRRSLTEGSWAFPWSWTGCDDHESQWTVSTSSERVHTTPGAVDNSCGRTGKDTCTSTPKDTYTPRLGRGVSTSEGGDRSGQWSYGSVH